ncbi:MAG: hypothetical protein FWD78_15365 [Treponema sp.]|nr:hypothetical protein [Treponema sp.]
MDTPIPATEREYLRSLAKKQLDYSRLPVMAERERLWFLHNRLAGKRPMVVMEEGTFIKDILPPRQCAHPMAARMEQQLTQVIAAYETFDDDKVVPGFFPVYYEIKTEFLGLRQKRVTAAEGLGFHIEPVFQTMEEGLPLIRPSVYVCDWESTAAYEKMAEDVLGDILPVVKKNSFNHWFMAPTQHVVELMGMENMYYAMMNEPDEFHELMRAVTEDLIRCLRWQEEKGLLLLNNGNDYLGAGSFCFSDELPGSGFAGTVLSRHTWGHLNSQESIGISPDQFAEFIYPYYEKLAAEFGLVYYGCCEPVHAYWDKSLCSLPGLRKISISAWCDEAFMAEHLSEPGRKVIYSRKPSPNFIGIKTEFDEEAFTAYIKKTASVLRGRVKAEFIFRDIYTLRGNLKKARQAVDITRKIAESMY